MKRFKKYSLLILLFIGLTFVGCQQDSDYLDSDELTGGADTGGRITFESESLGYTVGNGLDTSYDNLLTVFQGDVKVLDVDIYKTFTTVETTVDADGNEVSTTYVSNKILLRTISFPATEQHETFNLAVTYNELIEGLVVNGDPISSNDADLQIGDFWTLTFVSNLDNGKVHEVAESVKISVATRFAGNYVCLDALYYRIGVLTYVETDWPAITVIESVDATTYKVLEYFGASAFDSTTYDNSYFFQVDDNDKITYPANRPDTGTQQLGNGQPFITCESNPSDMNLVNCADSNKVIRDDINGKDQLIMSYGYYTAGSGPRTFYQVLEKI